LKARASGLILSFSGKEEGEMPIYEYRCKNCGKEFEVLQKVDDPPVVTCKYCQGEASRIISLTNFQLKGTGWYATDYKDKGKKEAERKGDKEKKAEGKEGAKDS